MTALISEPLEEQLRAAGEGDSVTANFFLRANITTGAGTKKKVRELIDRVHVTTGLSPTVTNIFEHIASFLVVAPVGFIRALIEQPEIARAMHNSICDGTAQQSV